jgi:hypothetical protein
MDPRRNPYAPGAGTPPPELAGRDEVIERASIALHRIANGRAAQSLILYGLRGVGKTVLLNRMRLDAEDEGYVPAVIEAPEDRSLPALLGPALRSALIRISRGEAVKKALTKALGALASFARSAKVKYEDVEFNVDFEALAGLADSGDLDTDLTDLLRSVGETAAERGTAVILQEWGKHAWSEAEASPITHEDALRATQVALAELDASFFRVRFDRLTPSEKRYLRAMAELGPGPHRSGDIADLLGKKPSAVAPVRNRIISKGMAYSPAHGDTAFTVPLFDSFMRRTMPELP